MVLKVRIEDHEIAHVALYEPLPKLLRLDVLPFVFLYATATYLYCLRAAEDPVATLFFTLIVFVHALAFLSGEWSVEASAWMTCTCASAISSDDTAKAAAQVLVKVVPARSTLPKQLCRCFVAEKPLQAGKEKLASGEQIPVVWFSYQNLNFCIYDALDAINDPTTTSPACFRRLDFPTQNALKSYLTSPGYTEATDLALASIKWGKNDFDIPIPLFGELLKEQLVAPFFVFQFFCMLLWCLDEYVYYSMLTLFMLVIFECTVVKQRQRNMETLNQMRRAPQSCLVYRSKRWVQIWSDQLVPGDICSIGVKMQPGFGKESSDNETGVPCDLLLLRGSCIVNESMLSGESIPLRKEAVGAGLDEKELLAETLRVDDGSSMQHKKHVLYGGTKILQHSLESDASSSSVTLSKSKTVPTPPDQGCVAFVLRTGFGTTQGSLVRTIIYSSQRVTANNSEAMWFIMFLLCFAICASGFVLHQGLQDASRDRFKLLLHCIMIVTSVVPPELPMELSLAVTNSLIALTKFNIFCTEPFRIPFAGRIDICCFDKTGTLTSDELKLLGVVGLETKVANDTTRSKKNHGELDIIAPEQLPLDSELVLAGCQSLVLLNGQVVGDPLELTAMRAIKWNLVFGSNYAQGGASVQPSFFSDRRGEIESVDILHRFLFSSEHKRMSTIVSITKSDNEESDERCILTKGAPEVLEPLFKDKPAYYRRVYRHFASHGSRVLALGYRQVPDEWTLAEIRQKARKDVEQDLIFAGFLVLDSPLKGDTKQTIRDLLTAKHKVVMVTGDNALTACDVARQVGINAGFSKQPLILSAANTGKYDTNNAVEWIGIDDGTPDAEVDAIPFDVNNMEKMKAQYDLCVTGEALSALYKQGERPGIEENAVLESFLQLLAKICLFINVFARTSPQQKEFIIMAMNRCGKTTAMCGDGTNDVGALKQAHIGISIVNSPSEERSKRDNNHGGGSKLEKRLRALQEEEDAASQVVRLGDASIASPFTSKSSSIRVAKQLIRQGRCTLVTTIQMYKILGVNCLITAYYLSTLYINGVKNGDQQLTIIGFLIFFSLSLVPEQLGIAMFFLFLSRAKPAKTLSHERPPHGVFCWSVLVSILGQFVIHLAVLAAALQLAQPFVNRADPSMHPDGKFTPNVINSIMFLLSAVMQITTFVANYKGQPFMESFWDNKLLYRSALFAYAVLGAAVAELFPPINTMLELVPLPNAEIQQKLFGLMAADTFVTLLFEYVVQQIASSLM